MQRIVSLVPSQTELLYSLGLEQEVVGITKFCVHPTHWRKEKTIVGGTKNFHFERIEALSPTLILGNKEENYKEGIEYLAERYPVWISDIVSWQDALDMIDTVGRLTCREKEATQVLTEINTRYQALRQALQPKGKVLYLIWREPFMAVGKDTFIHTMLELAGFENVCAHLLRYPELSEEAIQMLMPETIMLSSEPYPFQDKHIKELQKLCPQSTIKLVDGELFSWYGSRLVKGLAYLKTL
jgi:ABC-type Fe3+-hydroxamate transport system substrate-binding protein